MGDFCLFPRALGSGTLPGVASGYRARFTMSCERDESIKSAVG